jgi:hypothetical protein
MSEPAIIKMPDQSFEPLLSEAEAINLLGLGDRPNPASSLRWLIRKGTLSAVRLGRGILSFRRSDIEQCIQSCLEGKR